ncbi:MAG: glycosyltransferase [bacterium]|nr:glycosyltransferase [bacterium]
MMKIFIIAPYAPYPPNSGGRIRMWEQIQYLGQRHELTVVFFIHTPEEADLKSLLDGHCHRAIAVQHPRNYVSADFSPQPHVPLILRQYGTAKMRQTLASLSATACDVAILEHLSMAQYHDQFPHRAIPQEHNIESEIFRQHIHLPQAISPYFNQQKIRSFHKATWLHMQMYENYIWPKFPLRITVSEQDKQKMDCRCSTGKTIVIENGINTQSIIPLPLSHSRKVLFMGTLNYAPNIDAVLYMQEQILPEIWQHEPSISLIIAGRDPQPPIYDVAASDPRIELIANPADMQEIAQQCSLTVVPLRMGSGSRLKILHAMAMGLPVVSNSLGCEGLHVTDGQHLLVRDDPAQFAEAVLHLLSEPALRKKLSQHARQLVENHYDWQYIFAKLERGLLAFVHQHSSHSFSS